MNTGKTLTVNAKLLGKDRQRFGQLNLMSDLI